MLNISQHERSVQEAVSEEFSCRLELRRLATLDDKTQPISVFHRRKTAFVQGAASVNLG
jgi:hypothetical protein